MSFCLVIYTLYPRFFSSSFKYLPTFSTICFSHTLSTPIAPQSLPPCPGSITMTLPLALVVFVTFFLGFCVVFGAGLESLLESFEAVFGFGCILAESPFFMVLSSNNAAIEILFFCIFKFGILKFACFCFTFKSIATSLGLENTKRTLSLEFCAILMLTLS